MSFVWINGQLADKAEARISIFDHGFLYGDGVWEHFRAFGGRLFRPEAPLANLFAAADSLKIAIPLSQVELHAAIDSTLAANRRTEGYVRVVVTRGAGTLGPDPRKLDPQVIIIAEEYHPFPTELYENGLNVVSIRIPEASRLKRLGDSWRVRAKQAALDSGCLDAIVLDEQDRVICLTEGDLVLVKGGVLRTSSTAALFDEPFEYAELTLSHVLNADELFLAGVTGGIIAIVNVDGQRIGSGREGPIANRIRGVYGIPSRIS